MLKRLTAILLSLGLAFPVSATVIFKDPNQPTLIELQKGIDACNAGDEANCKYEHYPGVVRTNFLGNKVGPNDPRYILGDVLKPGTVLPRVEDPQALLTAIKNKNKVTIVSYLFSELQVASNGDLGEFLTDYVRHAAIPSEIVELAEQNGISAVQMYEHLANGLEQTSQQIIDDLQAQHEVVVAALEGQLAELSEQIAALEQALASLEAQHAAAISELESQHAATIASLEATHTVVTASLNSEIERLRSIGTAAALENADLRTQLEDALGEVRQLMSTEGRDWNAGDAIPGTTRNSEGTLESPHTSVSDILGSTPQAESNDDYTGLLRDIYYFTGTGTGLDLGGYISANEWDNLVNILENALQESYDEGYADGYTDGYSDGYGDGLADGRAGK